MNVRHHLLLFCSLAVIGFGSEISVAQPLGASSGEPGENPLELPDACLQYVENAALEESGYPYELEQVKLYDEGILTQLLELASGRAPATQAGDVGSSLEPSEEAPTDAAGRELTPLAPDTETKCTLLFYEDVPECTKVDRQQYSSDALFAAACSDAATDPLITTMKVSKCTVASNLSGEQVCASWSLSTGWIAAKEIAKGPGKDAYWGIRPFLGTKPILLKRGTSYEDVADTMKKNNCSISSIQVSLGHGRGLEPLKKQCLAGLKVGIHSTFDFGCTTFSDLNGMVKCMQEIQKEAKLEAGSLSVVAQQTTANHNGILGYDTSLIFCTVYPNPAQLVCRPDWCYFGASCEPDSGIGRAEIPAVCSVSGKDGKPNSLGCMKCVADGKRPNGAAVGKWTQIPLTECGAIPPEVKPIGVN